MPKCKPVTTGGLKRFIDRLPEYAHEDALVTVFSNGGVHFLDISVDERHWALQLPDERTTRKPLQIKEKTYVD